MLTSKERIYVQYQPDEEGLAQLLEWRELASRANTQGRPVQQDRLHVTVIHFGIIADVFRELTQQNSALDRGDFLKAAEQFIVASDTAMPKQVTVQPTGLEFFGFRSSVLALTATPDKKLTEAHRVSLANLKVFLKDCGIEYPVPFMQGSPNFRYALDLRPHISLIKAARHMPTDFPSSLPPLKLTLMPIRYT